MARGTAKFDTMKTIDVKVDSGRIPKSHLGNTDIDMNDKIRLEEKKEITLSKLDPLRAINKSISIDNEEMVVKMNGLSYSGSLGDDEWNKQREKFLDNTSPFKKNDTLKPANESTNLGSRTDRIETGRVRPGPGTVETISPAITPDKPITPNKTAFSTKVDDFTRNAKNTIGEIRTGVTDRLKKMSTGKKIGLGAAALATPYLIGRLAKDKQRDEEVYKGLLDFEKSPVLNAIKKVRKAKPIENTIKYGTIGTGGYFTLKPGDIETKAVDVGKLAKVAIPSVAGGFIASDVANRLQDRRTKKRNDGIVEEIVERLKTNRE